MKKVFRRKVLKVGNSFYICLPADVMKIWCSRGEVKEVEIKVDNNFNLIVNPKY